MVKRIVAELQRRGYIVWFDLERMKGSVMDAVRAPSPPPQLVCGVDCARCELTPDAVCDCLCAGCTDVR